jgi:hypothetical protein
MTAEGGADLIQSVRERRLLTLALAEQVGEERWREPALTGERTAHALFSHLLAWDEWATAAFELSALRPLPEKLALALRDVDAFNARAVARYGGLEREQLLAGLQGVNMRLVSAATATGPNWAERRIAELAPSPVGKDGQPSRGPSVAGLLRTLREHERAHDEEFSTAFGVSVDLDELRARLTSQSGQ